MWTRLSWIPVVFLLGWVLYYAFIGMAMCYGQFHAMGVIEHHGPNHSRAVVFRAFTNGKSIIPDIIMPVADGEITMAAGWAVDDPEFTPGSVFGETNNGHEITI